MISRVTCVLAIALWIAPSMASGHASGPKKPFTVRDSIETTQFVYRYGQSPVLLSPDGSRYLVVLERGNVARNGASLDLLSGTTESLRSARRPTIVAQLFSRSTASVEDLIENVRWLDDGRHVSFLWDDGEEPRSIVSLDIRNHEIRTLARHATPIVTYDITRDGRTIVFMTETQRNGRVEESLEKEGFAITSQSLWSILDGDYDGWTPRLRYDTFVLSGPEGLIRKVREPNRLWFLPPDVLKLSPDGRYAITLRPAGEAPLEWNRYTDHLFRDDLLHAARQNPNAPNLIEQLFVVDISRGTDRPLWNAPENAPARILWSEDSKSIVVGPTFLPTSSADAAGLSGQAIAEVNVATGEFRALPLPQQSSAYRYGPNRWLGRDTLELTGSGIQGAGAVPLTYLKTESKWVQVAQERPTVGSLPKVSIELREDLNTPPALYAVDSVTGDQEVIRDPNPQLKEFAFGRVELAHWKATDGRPWTGTLYYPVHYEPGRTYPLVIQTHGYYAARFLPDGTFTTAFAAQPLANHDIAVLQVGGPDPPGNNIVVSPMEPEIQMAGFEGAIDHFVAGGLVDRDKVGIIGFSRTGWYVEYMLTHSRYHLAAAEVADNMDGSYVQYVLSEAAPRAEYEADNGARAIGDGVEAWMRMAPGFNADKVHTPLRMEIDTGPVDSVLRDWELFSNLRYLRKPVELFVIPDIRRGVHVLQNPAQRLASQGATVDWFCFWLKGEEDSTPSKQAEYDRWRKLKMLNNP